MPVSCQGGLTYPSPWHFNSYRRDSERVRASPRRPMAAVGGDQLPAVRCLKSQLAAAAAMTRIAAQ